MSWPGDIEEPSDEEHDALAHPTDAEVTCKRCGQGPFTWLHTGVRWRLAGERGKLHECPGISLDDFD